MKQVLKNIIKQACGDLNDIFQDEFNKILSQLSTNYQIPFIIKSSKLNLKIRVQM